MLTPLTPAEAAEPPAFLTQFGQNCAKLGNTGCGACDNSECGAAGETAGPRGVATDPKTGHVFVADQLNFRIDEFTPWGTLVKAFGWDVAPGPVNEEQEIRVKAAAGQFRLSFEADTTPDLPFNASAAQVKTALNGLASISSKGAVNVEEVPGSASGTTPFIYVVTFDGGSLQANNVAQLSISDGTTPLGGGVPTTNQEARTRANGGAAGTGFEACTLASKCKAGLEGAGTGQLDASAGVAVASGGNAYVVDRNNFRVQKFDSAGEFVWMIGGEVNKTRSEELGSTEAQRNLCTAVSGDVCQRGTPGAGVSQFSGSWAFSSFISDGPEDIVYVGDKERIQRFKADGTALTPIPLPPPIDKGTVTALAVTPAGDIWVSTALDETYSTEPNVFRLDPTGTTKICEITVGKPAAVAVDGNGGVYVFAAKVYESPTEFDTHEIRQYDSGCNQVVSFAKHEFLPSGGIGMGVNGVGDLYVSNLSDSGANSFINAYGRPPTDYESPPLVPPQIIDEYAIAVGGDSATVGAQINPKFWTDASYYVEYGKTDCTEPGAGCKATPGAPLSAQPTGTPVATEGVNLSGLASNTTYHYRFVTQSTGGGPVFGKDATFTTFGGSEPLPDDRVWELVSPIGKDGGEVGVPGAAGGITTVTMQPQLASASGGALTYHSFTAFGKEPQSAPAAGQYLSHPAEPGSWATDNINPRYEEGLLSDPFVGFSEDLAQAVMIVSEPPLTPDATEGFPNMYLRNNLSGELTTITTKDHTPEVDEATKNAHEYCLGFGGASADYRRIFLIAKGALIEGDPKAKGVNLYEWTAAEGLRLTSILPNGSAATPSEGGFGSGGGCQTKGNVLRHAVSADGSRAFWTGFGGLFARVGGAETIQLDAPNQGVAGKGGAGRYQDASVDGSAVFFTSGKKLTSQPTAVESPDLYRYDFLKEAGQRLTNLTALTPEQANVHGVIGASADGTYVYFVATGVLDPKPNPEGASAKPGGDNLYVWHDGEGTRFLATLAPADEVAWIGSPNLDEQRARVSPDGRHLAFVSVNRLTGFDNTDLDSKGAPTGEADGEAFVYDYAADALTCASCSPSGARPLGPASLPAWSTPDRQARYLSDDGNRLFFETLDAIDPHDTNGKRDVYEFERSGLGACNSSNPSYVLGRDACIFLISSGKSPDQSYFLDASTSGNDIFFSTRQSLTVADSDERYDAYDARVGGNQPPAPRPPLCEDEGCREGRSAAPQSASPGTVAFQGLGNLVPPLTKPVVKPKVKALTRAQKLAKALKACRAKRNKHARTRCEAQARKRYASKTKSHKQGSRR